LADPLPLAVPAALPLAAVARFAGAALPLPAGCALAGFGLPGFAALARAGFSALAGGLGSTL